MSKSELEHVIVVNLAMNFPEINKTGGSRGFIQVHRWMKQAPLVSAMQSPCASSAAQALHCLPWCRLMVVTLNTVRWHTQPPLGSVHSAEIDELKIFSPLT